MIRKACLLACVVLYALIALPSQSFAQTTLINEHFGSASGLTAPGWSVFVTSGVDPQNNGLWRFDDPGGAFTSVVLPMAAPFASCNSDIRGPGLGTYNTTLVSGVFDASIAVAPLLSFDTHYRQLSDTAIVEAFDGTTWNNIGTVAPNWVTGSEVTAITFAAGVGLGGSSKGRIRFSYTADFDWFWGVDNVLLFDPAPVDTGAVSSSAPVLLANSCQHTLTATEVVTVTYQNFGTGPLAPGSLVNVQVTYNGIIVLTEIDTLPVILPAGATRTYTTLGTVNMSVPGTHTLDVSCRITGDLNAANDTLSQTYTSPAQTPVTFGWAETFAGLPSNAGAFSITNTSVPPGWDNAANDGASLAANTNADWGPNNGATGSSQGPTVDNTTGTTTGIYMYIEDSTSQPGDIELRTPCLDISGAVGLPTFRFHHHSKATAGNADDNVLFVDLIDVAAGGIVTTSIATYPGNGNTNWNQQTINLAPFGTNLLRLQFRVNNNNGTFTDDVAIDDCLLFDAIPTTGQAPQPGSAVFDINGGVNSLGNSVAVGGPGPFATTVKSNGLMNMTWSGAPSSAVTCFFGPQSNTIASYTGIGSLDVGSLPLNALGIPGSLVIIGDGNQPYPIGPFLNSFFVTDAAGIGSFSVNMPNFPLGYLTRFQCLMNSAGTLSLSNAVDVTIVP